MGFFGFFLNIFSLFQSVEANMLDLTASDTSLCVPVVPKKGNGVLRCYQQVTDLVRHKGKDDSEVLPEWRREQEPAGTTAPTRAPCSQNHLWICSVSLAPEGKDQP